MTLQDLEKIINAKVAFQGKKLEKYTTLTDKYLALTGITQLAGGKTIEQLFEAADNEEKEIIAGKLAWCIPGGKGMGGEDALKPKSEVDAETSETYTAEEAAAYNAQLPGAKTTNDWKVEPVEGVQYTEEEVLEANATLEGALEAGVALTAEQATAYNIAVTGAEKEADNELTAEEAAAYNANLEGAISTEDYKVEPVEGVKYTQEEADAYNAQLTGAVKEGDAKPEQS